MVGSFLVMHKDCIAWKTVLLRLHFSISKIFNYQANLKQRERLQIYVMSQKLHCLSPHDSHTSLAGSL